MKRLLWIAGILVAVVVRAATGDVSVAVEPNGWCADVTVQGFTSGAAYAFGMSGNNIPGANTPYFTVVSLGYDDTGTATTITRKVYLTSVIRFPYSTFSIPGTYTSGTFVDGETITEAVTGATGIVVGKQSSGALLIAKVVTGSPATGHAWTGGTSGAIFAQVGSTATLTLPTPDEKVPSGPNLVARIALSDYIYQKDNTGGGNSGTAPTFTAPSGFIVNSGGASQNSNVASAIAVTQGSTAAYQPCIANWSWPGFSLVQGSTLPLRVVAFHQSAQSGRPVRAVKFTVSDAHSHTQNVLVTAATYDSTVGDAVPVVEYVASIPTATFTNGDTLTANFTAYPWVGDSGATLTSSGGTQPTPLPAPETFVCDTSLTYGQTCALVDTGGSDSGANTVYDISTFNPATAYKFATFGKALAAIAAYNNTNHSRNDIGGGIVYGNTGTYNWIGSSNSYGGTNKVWATVTAVAGQTVNFNAQSGDEGAGDKLLISGCSVTGSATIMVNGQTYFWIDKSTINASGIATFYQNSVWYVTRCAIPQLAQGLQPFSTASAPVGIARGNNLNGFTGGANAWTFIGNLKTTVDASQSMNISFVISGSSQPAPQNEIVAFNELLGCYCNSNEILGNADFEATSLTGGLAIVQNVFETVISGSSAMVGIANDGSTAGTTNNVLFWHNTVVGQRQNTAYCSTSANDPIRNFWSMKFNAWENVNIKSDTFTGDGGASGVRTGNWPSTYSVNYAGNVDGEIVNIGSASNGGGFMPEFGGLYCYTPPINRATQPPVITGNANALGYMGFKNRQATTGLANGAGDGNYTPISTSPLVNMIPSGLAVLPVDIAGNTIKDDGTGAAGAYQMLTSSGTFLWWP